MAKSRPPAPPSAAPGQPAPALGTALALLERRPLTEAELRRGLEARGHAPGEIGAVVERLREVGHVNDERLALDYVVTRARRLGHGPERLLRDLERRGVPRAVARAAWQHATETGDLAPAEHLRAEVQRRLSRAPLPLDERAYARVYNALLRAGFEDDAILRELDPHRAEADAVRGAAGTDDDDLP